MLQKLPDNAHAIKEGELLQALQTQKEGLTTEEAKNRLQTFGGNQLTRKNKISPLSIFLEQFKNVLIMVLLGAAFLILLIYFLGEKDPADLIEAGLIFAIVILIAALGFFQEYKAEKAVEKLKELLSFKAKVKRSGKELEIEVADLVPGDIVILEEGTKVPADIRLLEVYSLHVNEAPLTGESVPVEKNNLLSKPDAQISDQKNMVFSGTAITSGRAIGVVIKTGDKTEIGKIAELVSQTRDEQTPIQKRLDQIGKILSYAVLGIASIVFIFILFFAHDYQHLPIIQKVIHSFIASVALAVAAIPEGLPAVVTIALALGTQRMLKKKALVRKLNSIETLGSTDVICSDKTGTLTKGEMTVREVYFNQTNYQVSGSGYDRVGKFTKDQKAIDPKELELLLEIGLICNNSNISPKGIITGDPTEAALLVSAFKAGMKNETKRLQEIPFSSERKKMTVVIQKDKELLSFQKGAIEEVLKECTKMYKNGKVQTLTEADKTQILNEGKRMAEAALRTLAFAYKPLAQTVIPSDPPAGGEGSPANAGTSNKLRDSSSSTQNDKFEKDLIFVGLQGMYDPPRLDVKPLIETCLNSGIRVIMITGDHLDTAKAVAHEIGILGEALTGDDLEKMSTEELIKKVEEINIYARVNPSTKMKIVEALQHHKHIVAMTGDGVNDAPALKKADIGIAMGITGTDVAKESADMVLMDDKFSTIVAAIEEGRGIFHNIRKFVNYLLACNIGEVILVFAAVIIFQELPLTATMLLWINVVTDGLPAVALGMDPAEKGIMKYKPAVFQSEIITKKLWLKMIIFGGLLTIGVLGIYMHNLPEGVNEAQGAAFMAIVIFELVKLFIIRSNFNTSFFSNSWLIIAIIGSLILQIMIVYIPVLANLFDIHHIDAFDWLYMLFGSIILWVTFQLIQFIIDKLNIFPEDKKVRLA